MRLQCAVRGGIVAMILASAACTDAPLGPRQLTSAPPRAVTAAVVTPLFMGFSADGDTLVARFTIHPRGRATYLLGRGHLVTIPSGVTCDPELSSYGPGTWDDPCPAAAEPITVTARTWNDESGRPHVDFAPHLRFAPTDDPARMAWLSLYDREAASDPSARILFCEENLAECVDEALSDPSLATLRDPFSGYVYRRIKHFSGYNMAARAAAY
jgi:hypothetical protein